MSFYRLSFRYNDTYAFRERPFLTRNQHIHQEIVPDMSGSVNQIASRCKKCGELLDKQNQSLVGLQISKRKFDISKTYDGIMIASKRFRKSYVDNGLTGLIFTIIPDDHEFYSMHTTRRVKYDSKQRETEFFDECPFCNQYKSIIGATPIILMRGESIEDTEFVATDIEFGNDDQKSPLLLCGETCAKVLKQAQLKGVDLVSCS